MKKHTDFKRSKKALAICAAFAVMVSGILAFLVATDKQDNVFTMGNVSVKLHEDDWFEEINNVKTPVQDERPVSGTLRDYYNEGVSAGHTVQVFDENDNLITLTYDENNEINNFGDVKKIVITHTSGNHKNRKYIYQMASSPAGAEYVIESNGINDFAENLSVGQSIDKTPWVENTGKNPAWVFISVGIPTVSTTEALVTEETFQQMTDKEFKIKVACYAFQANEDEDAVLDTVWKSYADGNELFGLNRLEPRVPIIKVLDYNLDDWVLVDSRDSNDNYDYYVYAYKYLVPAKDSVFTEDILAKFSTDGDSAPEVIDVSVSSSDCEFVPAAENNHAKWIKDGNTVAIMVSADEASTDTPAGIYVNSSYSNPLFNGLNIPDDAAVLDGFVRADDVPADVDNYVFTINYQEMTETEPAVTTSHLENKTSALFTTVKSVGFASSKYNFKSGNSFTYFSHAYLNYGTGSYYYDFEDIKLNHFYDGNDIELTENATLGFSFEEKEDGTYLFATITLADGSKFSTSAGNYVGREISGSGMYTSTNHLTTSYSGSQLVSSIFKHPEYAFKYSDIYWGNGFQYCGNMSSATTDHPNIAFVCYEPGTYYKTGLSLVFDTMEYKGVKYDLTPTYRTTGKVILTGYEGSPVFTGDVKDWFETSISIGKITGSFPWLS